MRKAQKLINEIGTKILLHLVVANLKSYLRVKGFYKRIKQWRSFCAYYKVLLDERMNKSFCTMFLYDYSSRPLT